MRYGLWQYVERIARAQIDAAALFEHYRLPEVFTGHPRDSDHPFPAFYPQANSPQAWSASAVFCLVQAMLGLYPYAPLRTLFVDPNLPDWLPEIRLRNLRVKGASATIRFDRDAEGRNSYTVEELRGRLHIIKQPSPWSLPRGAGVPAGPAFALAACPGDRGGTEKRHPSGNMAVLLPRARFRIAVDRAARGGRNPPD